MSWARHPSPAHEKGGLKGSAWEKAIVDMAASGDVRFLHILRDHIEAGAIRSARAHAVLSPEAANA